jgi:hypothetical protein
MQESRRFNVLAMGLVIALSLVTISAQEGKLLRDDQRCGQEMVKGSGAPRDCARQYEGEDRPTQGVPRAPESPKVTAVPAPTALNFNAGPVKVSQTLEYTDAQHAVLKLQLSDASGKDVVEIDNSRLTDTTYTDELRGKLEHSQAAQEYRRRLERLGDAIDKRQAQGKVRISPEEALMLTHAQMLDSVTLAQQPAAMTASLMRHARRNGVRTGPKLMAEDCFQEYQTSVGIAMGRMAECGARLWNTPYWFAYEYAMLGYCSAEFSMRNAAATGQYMRCAAIGMSGTYGGVTGKIGS